MGNVKRTSMFLDRDLVEEAADALGTKGVTETVHAAMREVLAMRAGSELADLLASGAIGLPTREELGRWDDDGA
jgi:Arc/MetJ family transcription regulator